MVENAIPSAAHAETPLSPVEACLTGGLPAQLCNPPFHSLPEGIHRATLNEVYRRFVEQAPEPTKNRRALIFQTLSIHVSIVRQVLRDEPLTLWVNGGFTTHKPDKPRDADLVYFTSTSGVRKMEREAMLPLRTLHDVTSREGTTGKLHPMGGLIDAYFAVDNPAMRELWRQTFSGVKGSDDQSQKKGFVEVIFDE